MLLLKTLAPNFSIAKPSKRVARSDSPSSFKIIGKSWTSFGNLLNNGAISPVGCNCVIEANLFIPS